jgi:PAS domain S-box-containing protein
VSTERESLEVSYERDRFFDLSMDLLCIAGGDGYFKRLNPAWERALGFSREELCSKPFIEFIHSDDRARTQDVMEKLSRGQPAINFENRYRCRDGSYRWLSWITPAPEQNPPIFYAAARDITEHKQMEEALRQANNKLEQHVAERTQELAATNAALRVAESWQRALIDSIQGIVWECDARTWKFSFVSHQAELVLGYPVHRWLDEPDFWPAHIHQNDRDWVMEYCLASSRDKRKYSFEYRMIAADGRTVWLEDIVTVETDELGPTFLRGIMVDITERKQAEAALRESEARFRSLFEEVPIAYQSLDIEGRYLDVNKGLCTLLGYSPDELQGKPFDDFWPSDARQFFPDEFDSFKRNGGATKHLRLRRKDGEEIAVILEGRVQRDLEGNFLRTHCILTDITDQKLIEENLRRSEVFIASVLENLPNMIFVKDAEDLRFVRFNKAGEELLGYRRHELLGKNDYDCFPKEEADFFAAKDREVLRSGCLLDIPEEPIQTKDGEMRFLHTKKIPICSADGMPQYLLGISEDITERKQAEEERKKQELLVTLMLNTGPGCIKRLAADGTLRQMNPAGLKLIEADCEEDALGRSVFMLVVPEHLVAFIEMHRDVINGCPRTLQFEIMGLRGTRRWMETHAVPFQNPVTGQTEHLAVTHDITERYRSEEALRASEEQLRKVLEEREQLSRDLHDNIIQSIYAIGMSLEECRYLFQKDQQEADKKLEYAVASLNRVISDVRVYIVWEKHEGISGQQFCAKLAELAVSMESAQGIHFSLDLAAEAAQRLTPLGAFHILHIVQEAMSNSLRHSKSRSGLVSLQMEGRRIRLEIRDDGVGFNIEEVAGQGHGLQNMTARAQKLGADLQIVSNPGLGVQILVELPLED